ncbi:ATP-binding protein [Loktanella salsilacus]|uniref:PAS domain-containing sensor histidine kinase n=1 Tax=Loktanella salsilacus TaxID=195913 RepID=UPI003703DE81
MFRSIVENAPIGVLIIDSSDEVIFCNLMALSILLMHDETIVGRKILDILPEISILEKLPIQNKSYNGDAEIISILSADGNENYCGVQLSRPAGAHDNIKHIVTLTDVTRRVRALQAVQGQEHRWDLALQGSQIGVFESDLRTGTGFASQTWFELLGISKAKERDSDAEWHARVHPDDLALVVSSDAQCIEGLSEKSEASFRMMVQDGTWHWMKSILRVTERDGTGKAVRLLGTMVDITEQKRVDELKDDFVATVSHELRTPLAAVYGALRLLSESMSMSASEKTKKLFGMAYRNTSRLIQVVDELLDFQKLKTGHFSVEMSRVDIVDIVNQVGIDNELYAKKYEVTLIVDTPKKSIFLNADPLRLKQVLTNLVSNSAKFSFPNGSVIIRIELEKSNCMISIIDNGHGISSDFSKRIFIPFSQQADHLTRNSGGSGLGLAISKSLIELMSGEIGYHSEPNVETTFWVKIPVMS